MGLVLIAPLLELGLPEENLTHGEEGVATSGQDTPAFPSSSVSNATFEGLSLLRSYNNECSEEGLTFVILHSYLCTYCSVVVKNIDSGKFSYLLLQGCCEGSECLENVVSVPV